MTDKSESSKPAQTLTSKMARGVAWMMMAKVGMNFLSLISTLILVRLLTPQDFGLVAMAMVFVAIMGVFAWFSFDVILIQKQTANRDHYDTAWTFNVIFHTVSALVLVAIAYPASLYYSEPRVVPIMLVLAAGQFINGLENIGVINFRKNMQFNKEFMFLFSKKLIGFCITVPLAFIFRNYLALIIGVICSNIAGFILSYIMDPYRPRLSLKARHELFNFSKWLFFSNIFYALRMRGADLIVGRIAGTKALGLFTVSYEISNLPSTELIAPINRAVFPGYAKISSDMAALRKGYLDVISMIALLIIPAGTGMAACAPVLVPVALGEQWLETTTLISILAFYGVLAGLQTNIASIYIALGKPKILTALHLLHLVVLIAIAIPATLKYNILGTAWSYLGVSALLLPINYMVMFKTISLSAVKFLSRIWRPVLSAFCMFFVVRKLSNVLYERADGLPNVLDLAIAVCVGVAVYAIVEWVSWLLSGRQRGAETYILETVKARLKGSANTAQ